MDERLRGLWRMARPAQVALIGLLYWLGAALALVDGAALDGRALAAGAVTLLFVAASVHYADEYADRETDALADRTPFSGGSGALTELSLPASVAARATVGAGALAVLALALAGRAGLPPSARLALAVVLAAGWAYSLPPVRLVARGLGEATNLALGAVVLPLAGHAALAPVGVGDVLAVVPFAWLVVPNLLATHYADREADAATGKRTLAVRLGPARLRALGLAVAASYPAVAAGAFLAGALAPAVFLAHVAVLPLVAWAAGSLTRRRSPLPAVAAMVALAVASALAWTWTWLAHA